MDELKQKQEKTWAMSCHLSSLLCYVGFPLGNIVGPLVTWLLKRDEFALVDEQGKESLNFQISLTIYFIVSMILMVVLIGFFLIFAIFLFHVIMVIQASIAMNKGESWRYPLCIRFIK